MSFCGAFARPLELRLAHVTSPRGKRTASASGSDAPSSMQQRTALSPASACARLFVKRHWVCQFLRRSTGIVGLLAPPSKAASSSGFFGAWQSSLTLCIIATLCITASRVVLRCVRLDRQKQSCLHPARPISGWLDWARQQECCDPQDPPQGRNPHSSDGDRKVCRSSPGTM